MTRTKKTPSKNISIEDVARQSGVSITTVSRVINKIGTVKEKNRSKVMSVVKELKFQPSIFAQRLATGKSNVVALLIPRYEGVFYSFYALDLIRATGTLCEAFKLDLLLHLTSSHTRIPLNLRGVGGIIFSDIIGTRFQVEEAIRLGIPSVVINNYVRDLPVSSISIDNSGGAKSAVNYLINLGHRKIAHISGDVSTQAAAMRLEGYIDALKENNIAVNGGPAAGQTVPHLHVQLIPRYADDASGLRGGVRSISPEKAKYWW